MNEIINNYQKFQNIFAKQKILKIFPKIVLIFIYHLLEIFVNL